MRLPHTLHTIPAYLLTLLIAFAAAQLFVWVHVPLPWLTGPLLITGMLSVMQLPVVSLVRMRNLAQWAMGSALGMYFSSEIVELLSQLWWAVGLSVIFSIALGLLSAQFITWCNRGNSSFSSPAQLRSTAYYAGAIGAASEMSILSERSHARTDLVAASHSLRLMLVTLCVPFIVALLERELPAVNTTSMPLALSFKPSGFAIFALLTGAGVVLFQWFKQPNPWFLGPFTASVIIALSDLQLSAMPTGLSSAAQLVIGISLGVRFNRQFLKSAPRWALSIALLSLCLITLCAGFAWLLWQSLDLDYTSLLLATAPGGIVEMSITAKIFALSVPVVTSFQVTRLVAVLLLTEPFHRWLYLRHNNAIDV
jgi:membrane AbrB-like protein